MRKVKFLEWDCYAKFGNYSQSMTVAIELVEQILHEPVAIATVNAVNKKPAKGNVFIKEYSENKGMTQALIDAGIIGEPVNSFHLTMHPTLVNECPLLINPEKDELI